jgi:hypothetical protein
MAPQLQKRVWRWPSGKSSNSCTVNHLSSCYCWAKKEQATTPCSTSGKGLPSEYHGHMAESTKTVISASGVASVPTQSTPAAALALFFPSSPGDLAKGSLGHTCPSGGVSTEDPNSYLTRSFPTASRLIQGRHPSKNSRQGTITRTFSTPCSHKQYPICKSTVG